MGKLPISHHVLIAEQLMQLIQIAFLRRSQQQSLRSDGAITLQSKSRHYHSPITCFLSFVLPFLSCLKNPSLFRKDSIPYLYSDLAPRQYIAHFFQTRPGGQMHDSYGRLMHDDFMAFGFPLTHMPDGRSVSLRCGLFGWGLPWGRW